MNKIQFPKRLHGSAKEVAIILPQPMGGSAKIFLREIAKKLPEYRQPIETGIAGHTDDGREIPIDTVGKWLFGVPGYQGHIVVSNWKGATCTVEFPTESPRVVHDLIAALKIDAEVQGAWCMSS